MIVEDNDLSRRRLENLLNQRGYRIIEVLDGDTAVDEFVKHEPDIVLLALDPLPLLLVLALGSLSLLLGLQ